MSYNGQPRREPTSFWEQAGQLAAGLGKSKIPVRIILIGVLLVLLIPWLGMTTWFRVEEHEEALVYNLGRGDRQVAKGIHGKLPWPFEKVSVHPVRITQQLTFGYTIKDGKDVLLPEEALMITGDENIIWVDALVEYRITDINKYENAAEDPMAMVKHATAASLRSVIGTKQLDTSITTGKFDIQTAANALLNELVNRYDIGIKVESLKLQDVEPPDNLKAAFKSVNDAREDKSRKVNEAEKYKNERIPKARGEAQQLIEHATGSKSLRVNTAFGDVAKFKAVLDAYNANPTITEKRLVIETLEQVLPGAEITIMDNRGGTVQYLPIDIRR